MESINFLKDKLSEVYRSLPYLQIRYEYKLNINTHVIEVKPNYCYEKDSNYIDAQLELEDSFEELFVDEEIVFITENELIQVEDPILELGVLDRIIEEIEEELNFQVVVPSTKIVHPTVGVDIYDTGYGNIGFTYDFEIPPPKPISTWKKLKSKLKNNPESNSGSFFYINLQHGRSKKSSV